MRSPEFTAERGVAAEASGTATTSEKANAIMENKEMSFFITGQLITSLFNKRIARDLRNCRDHFI